MHPFKARLLAILVPCLTAGPLGAATINWGAATGITSDLDVSTNGTLVRAYNFGVDGSVTPTTTLNGVEFTNITSGTLGTSHAALDGATELHTIVPKAGGYSDTIGFINGRAASGNPYNGMSAEYQSFLSTIVYAGGANITANPSSARNSYTFTLGNLTIGQTYAIQIWMNDGRSSSDNRGGTIAGGVTLDANTNAGNSAGGVGQYTIGEFTADATTQSFDITATGSKAVAAQLNGYQLRAIPEPSITLLGGLGFAIAAARRRRI